MSTTIHITSKTFGKTINLCQKLTEQGFNLKVWDEVNSLESFLLDAQWIIVGTEKIDRSLLTKLKHVKGISKYGVGADNLDFTAMDELGIQYATHPGTNRTCVAEFALSFMLAAIHRIPFTSQNLKQGIWHKDGGRNLTGKTVGIIGFGNVGSTLANLLAPFDVQLLASEIDQNKQLSSLPYVHFTTLDKVLKESDIVSLHVPLTSATKNLMNDKTLKQMKSDAILVNAARGEVVDHAAIIHHLKTHKHFQYLADVFTPEPYQGELITLANFMGTPHSAGNSVESVQYMGEAAINGIIRLLKART